MDPATLVRYARVIRFNTRSRTIIKLPQPMRTQVAIEYVTGLFDESWELTGLYMDHPEGTFASMGYDVIYKVLEQ